MRRTSTRTISWHVSSPRSAAGSVPSAASRNQSASNAPGQPDCRRHKPARRSHFPASARASRPRRRHHHRGDAHRNGPDRYAVSFAARRRVSLIRVCHPAQCGAPQREVLRHPDHIFGGRLLGGGVRRERRAARRTNPIAQTFCPVDDPHELA